MNASISPTHTGTAKVSFPAKKPATEVAQNKSSETTPPAEQKDSVSLGYKLGRGVVATVGGGVGLVAGSLKGAVTNAASGKNKARPAFHKAARYAGAAIGLALAGLSVAGGGGIAAVGGLLLAPVLGAAAGAGVVAGLEAGADSGAGALKGMKDGASLGWQIAGGAVDRVAGWFGAGDKGESKPPAPPSEPDSPKEPGQ